MKKKLKIKYNDFFLWNDIFLIAFNGGCVFKLIVNDNAFLFVLCIIADVAYQQFFHIITY